MGNSARNNQKGHHPIAFKDSVGTRLDPGAVVDEKVT